MPALLNKYCSDAFRCTFFYIFAAQIVLLPFLYWYIISIPDSTDYFLQRVDSAKSVDGKNVVYVGDDLHIVAYNWRHIVNGTCWIWVERNRENVGGKFAGRRHVMEALPQQFIGDGIIRQTSWPIAPKRILITEDWFDDNSVDEQDMDVFTTGYFDCNPLDRIRIALGIPRLHHNAKGQPERERTRITLRRNKPELN